MSVKSRRVSSIIFWSRGSCDGLTSKLAVVYRRPLVYAVNTAVTMWMHLGARDVSLVCASAPVKFLRMAPLNSHSCSWILNGKSPWRRRHAQGALGDSHLARRMFAERPFFDGRFQVLVGGRSHSHVYRTFYKEPINLLSGGANGL